MLCCSYHCGDDARALGLDGPVAGSSAVERLTSSVSDNKTQNSVIAKQHTNSSAGTVNVSDAARSNKTEGTAG